MSYVPPTDLGVLNHILLRLEEQWVPGAEVESSYYPYMALPMIDFLDGLRVATAHFGADFHRQRFLDVGCGIGTKLLAASRVGYAVAGIDIAPAYLKVARRLAPEATLHECNAFDFNGYGEYDVVYTYRLCVEDELQRVLSDHIIGQMRPGSLLFSVGSDGAGRQLAPHLWEV